MHDIVPFGHNDISTSSVQYTMIDMRQRIRKELSLRNLSFKIYFVKRLILIDSWFLLKYNFKEEPITIRSRLISSKLNTLSLCSKAVVETKSEFSTVVTSNFGRILFIFIIVYSHFQETQMFIFRNLLLESYHSQRHLK